MRIRIQLFVSHKTLKDKQYCSTAFLDVASAFEIDQSHVVLVTVTLMKNFKEEMGLKPNEEADEGEKRVAKMTGFSL